MKLSIGVQGSKQQKIKKVRVAVRGTRKMKWTPKEEEKNKNMLWTTCILQNPERLTKHWRFIPETPLQGTAPDCTSTYEQPCW
jgi:hypothetical protein